MKRVLVTDGLDSVGVDALRKHGLEVDVVGSLDERALAARLGEYEGLIVRSAT
jgi:D-3-phosphoglycerate dehydrogenase